MVLIKSMKEANGTPKVACPVVSGTTSNSTSILAQLLITHNVDNPMDQNSSQRHDGNLLDLVDNQVLIPSKKKVARRRWAILAKALKSPSVSEPSSPTDEYSVRRISSFMLLSTARLDGPPPLNCDVFDDRIPKRTWYKYSMTIQDSEFFVNIGHKNRTFSAEDLMGFNNTGNVCIWPSEETLAYYVGANLNLFENQSVLELGGGMSCLAGLFCAKYATCKHVLLTDGNKTSVENVETSLHANDLSCPVACKVLKWEEYESYRDDAPPQFDVVLCADCLFFDDARLSLIDCLWSVLSSDGLALVMAPKRGGTLESFVSQAEAKGLVCRRVANYNETVWQKHLALLDNCEYNENIHYPILLEVTKPK